MAALVITQEIQGREQLPLIGMKQSVDALPVSYTHLEKRWPPGPSFNFSILLPLQAGLFPEFP